MSMCLYLKNKGGNMKDLRLKDIYAGLPDAKDEYAYEDFDTISKCFVSPPNFDIDELISGNKCFIRGYKGTGKTALLYYISNKLIEKDETSCISFILFKNFDNAEKEKIQNIALNINKPKEFNLSVPNDYDITSDGYIYIWKWILLEQIIRDNDEYSNRLFVDDSNYKNFVKTLKIITYERINKQPFKFPSSISFACGVNIPPYNVIIKPEMKMNFNNSHQNAKLFEFFKKIIDDSIIALSKCTRTDIPYYIMLDELEAFYQKEEIFKRDLFLLRDLIFCVKDFNLLFKQSNFKNTKLICCIRTEIVNAINKYIPTYEINKITNGFEFPLLWNYNNNNNIKHPIFQILLKRIEYTELKENEVVLSDEEAFHKWFEPEIDGNSIIEVFLNQTWNKPRDVVRFLIAVQSSLSSSCKMFTKQVFNDSMDEYSKKSLEELKEELNASYSKEQIDEMFIWLNGFRTIFTLKELQERINKYFPSSTLKDDIPSVLKSLFRVGVIGNYSKITQNFLWKHRGNDDPVFDDEWLFYVHRGLFKSLSINTKTNFKKYLYSNKKEVKVGEIFECSIYKVLPKSILVSFNDNYMNYKGYIPISEIADRFITQEYMFENFTVGDTIFAKLLEYDEQHSNWRMSIKGLIEDSE